MRFTGAKASQAQTIPYYCNNLLEFPSMQYHFALGTKPDVIVLCINYYDEISYIKNSLYALMGLTGAKILAFMLYPITYTSDKNGVYGNDRYRITYQDYEKRASELFQEFKIPTFLLGNRTHMRKLCNEIIDFF